MPMRQQRALAHLVQCRLPDRQAPSDRPRAAALTSTNGAARRSDRSWMRRASRALPVPGRAADQHRRSRRAACADQLPSTRRAAGETPCSGGISDLRPRPQQHRQPFQKDRHVEGLGDVVRGAGLHQPHRLIDAALPGDEQEGRRRDRCGRACRTAPRPCHPAGGCRRSPRRSARAGCASRAERGRISFSHSTSAPSSVSRWTQRGAHDLVILDQRDAAALQHGAAPARAGSTRISVWPSVAAMVDPPAQSRHQVAHQPQADAAAGRHRAVGQQPLQSGLGRSPAPLSLHRDRQHVRLAVATARPTAPPRPAAAEAFRSRFSATCRTGAAG